MEEGRLIFISGGARSGKSRLAQDLAQKMKGRQVTYLATGEARDEEMAARIKAHQQARPASWKTVEEPLHILPVMQREMKSQRLILIDCMTLWLSNMLLINPAVDEGDFTLSILKELEDLMQCQQEEGGELILVSNEVGMGIVPETPLGRVFRDVNGRMNTFLAGKAHQVFLMFFGLPLTLKSLTGRGTN